MTHPPSSRSPKRPANRKSKSTARRKGFLLMLFVAGMSARSVTAIRSIKRICEQHLGANYDLEIVDLYRDPARAQKEQIVALPTLIKKKPYPMRRIIGSMVDEARLAAGLGVKHK